MIARAYGNRTLVFDREAIVRAALYAYVEGSFIHIDPLKRLAIAVSARPFWKGDFQQGAFYNGNGCGDYEVVAWTEAGVVGLGLELGAGPIEQLDLAISAVTRGPEDVRGAVPGLPAELEPTFLLAASMLEEGGTYMEKLAGVGFWFDGNRVDGSLFHDPIAAGAYRLVAWGALQDGRLPLLCDPETAAVWAEENARRGAAPIQALVGALVARALTGPTELTPAEVETLLPTPPKPERLFSVQRRLEMVGITWPGSPEIPPEPPPGPNPFLPQAR